VPPFLFIYYLHAQTTRYLGIKTKKISLNKNKTVERG